MLGKADAATNLIIFSQVLIDFAARENLEDAWGTFVEKRSNSPLFIMVLERYELKRWHLRHLTGVTWYVPPVTNIEAKRIAGSSSTHVLMGILNKSDFLF